MLEGDKVAVSVEDLNEVRTSLESSIDTKMSKMETQLDTLTALINNLMNKDKPAVAPSDEVNRALEAAKKAANDEQFTEDDPENKRDGASTTSQGGGDKYNKMPPPSSFQSADPPMNHPHINNIGDPPKINAIDFE